MNKEETIKVFEKIANQHIYLIESNSQLLQMNLDLMKESDKFRKGFNILMEYFDSISDEEKPKVSKELERLGL